jgi:CBS domain-containing protein
LDLVNDVAVSLSISRIGYQNQEAILVHSYRGGAGKMATQSRSNDLFDAMTRDPVALPATTTLAEAARSMRFRDLGDVIVLDDSAICVVVTDRDIVVRAIAEDRDPEQTTLGDICSRDLVTLDANGTVDDAIALMREHAIRRLPVTKAGKPVGMVSIGDIAMMREPNSALADISAAPSNT